ncbi:dITP/XTP pyrophosphatase [Thalassocella blandensis]|nr:dITP/XTP pyrophosphatase [Thalassocella blandensis]
MQKLVLASGNAGKLKEFQALLHKCGFEVCPQSDYAVSSVAETGLSFVENALIKARHASKATGLPALADDSGIEVDALNGAPGIYSARFAGPDANDQRNNAKLLEALAGMPEEKRTARYQCVLVFMRHELDPTPIIAQGAWEGRILETPQGNNGFGYDPLFWVPTHHMSSAQLDKAEKNAISHRAIAMQHLLRALQTAV